MPEPRGPWADPPSAPQRGPRRLPLGLILWLSVLALAFAGYWGMTQIFPGQIAAVDLPYALQAFGALAVVSSGLVYARRIKLGQTARFAALWAVIGLAIAIGYTFREEVAAAALRVRGELLPAYAVTAAPHTLVLTRGADGGFYVMGEVNGAPVKFLADTGSSDIVLSPADAGRLGVDIAALTFSASDETANGVGHGAPFVVKSLAVGPIRFEGVPVSINQAPMSVSLLGMSFFKRLKSVELRGDRLILTAKS